MAPTVVVYVEPFVAVKPHREEPAAGLAAPYVELHLAVGSKSDGALDRAARALAARLAALVEGGEVILECHDAEERRAHQRPLDYGDVAILCRASTAFPAYENALDFIALGFRARDTKIFLDTEYMQTLYQIAVKVAKRITFSTTKAVFGFTNSNNIGSIFYTSIQAAPCFLETENQGKP